MASQLVDLSTADDEQVITIIKDVGSMSLSG
jgi:hypothetical protein